MSKVPLAEQIEAVRESVICAHDSRRSECLDAAFATLKLLQRYESEVRDLIALCLSRDEHFPGAEIRVSTPHSTAVSAIAQERDEGGE